MTITRRWQSGFETGTAEGITLVNGADIYNSGYLGSYSLRADHGANNRYSDLPITSTAQMRTGFFYQCTSWTGGDNPYMFCVNGNPIFVISKPNTTDLRLTVNGVQQDQKTVYSHSTWIHVGIDVKIHSSAGWVKVYIDGVEKLSFTGNTGSTNITHLYYGHYANGTYSGGWQLYDCIYVDDTTGESSAAALPIKKFYYVTPNGNGNYSQWDGSDGNSTDNYALVDEVPPNSDTDYVYNYVADELDSYAMTSITLSANESVVAVIPTAYTKRASTTEQIALGTRYNSTDSIGSDQSPSVSYGCLRERQTTKPGGGAWDQTSIDGMEVVIKARGTY